MTFSLREATPDDTGVIRNIAHRTWPIAYAAILSPKQIDYMLELFYSSASLLNQFKNLGHRFVILHENGIPAGFASFSVKSNDEPQQYRLHKLYVLPALQGKGYGRVLLDHIIDQIKAWNGHTLELNVNRHNKAFDFYTHNGFTIIREEDIDIGNGYFMNDYVMAKML